MTLPGQTQGSKDSEENMPLMRHGMPHIYTFLMTAPLFIRRNESMIDYWQRACGAFKLDQSDADIAAFHQTKIQGSMRATTPCLEVYAALSPLPSRIMTHKDMGLSRLQGWGWGNTSMHVRQHSIRILRSDERPFQSVCCQDH